MRWPTASGPVEATSIRGAAAILPKLDSGDTKDVAITPASPDEQPGPGSSRSSSSTRRPLSGRENEREKLTRRGQCRRPQQRCQESRYPPRMGLYNSLQQFFLVALNMIAGESNGLVHKPLAAELENAVMVFLRLSQRRTEIL